MIHPHRHRPYLNSVEVLLPMDRVAVVMRRFLFPFRLMFIVRLWQQEVNQSLCNLLKIFQNLF